MFLQYLTFSVLAFLVVTFALVSPTSSASSNCGGCKNEIAERLSTVVPLVTLGNKTYYIGNNFVATFLEAFQFCQIIQLQLATIKSDEENNALQKYIQDSGPGDHRFWTSGNKQINKKTWVWLSTGEPLEYTHWQSGEPDNPNSELCIAARLVKGGFLWNNAICSAQRFFICEKPVTPTRQCCCQPDQVKTNSSTGGLPVTYVDGKRYLIGTTKVNYYEASEVCTGYGMQLLSIANKEKNDAVITLLENSPDDYYWTSGNKLSDAKTWTWSNGDPVTYFSWSPGEPNNLRLNEYCLNTYKNGYWNDLPCADDVYFICEDVEKRNCCCG